MNRLYMVYTCMYMELHCTYKTVNVCAMYIHVCILIYIFTYFKQGFVANREMLFRVMSLCPPLPWMMGMGAAPVQKMVNFSMQGQMLQKWSRAGYLQLYETLLKELNEHPVSNSVPPDQHEVECASLADRNLNVPCESGICFHSYMVMLLRQSTQSKISVIYFLVHVYTVLRYV